jgi:O-antigen biosynthesis protein
MANKHSNNHLYDKCFNSYVYNSIDNNKTCLDVGCSTGNLGRKIIKNKKCIIDGVDINQIALFKAQKSGYRKTYKYDLNNFKNTIKNKYDYIIFADVLEHLIDPEYVLNQFKKNLNKNGSIIISIPNFAFIQNRINILFGKFYYSVNGGILDINHLRFYTKKSFIKHCVKSNFTIKKIQGYCQVKKRFFFLRTLSKIFDTVFSIQFLIILKNKT